VRAQLIREIKDKRSQANLKRLSKGQGEIPQLSEGDLEVILRKQMTTEHGKAIQARRSSEHDSDYELQESKDDVELHVSKKRKLDTSKKSPSKSSVSSSPKSKPTSTKSDKKERPLVFFGKNPTMISKRDYY
jgi:hypothetical protein